MDYWEVLTHAIAAIQELKGRRLDILTISKPRDVEAAVELSKVIGKLSPIVGNTLEYAVVRYLNAKTQLWPDGCRWIRQDPAFPDAVLEDFPEPRPGVEIKTWFPLATEITARFRDSQTMLQQHNTIVAVICWLPEFVIAGRPKVVDVFIADALDLALARDTHYHNPPHYVVMEPEDTSKRTRNLQQKNCNGLAYQGTPEQLEEALALVDAWGAEGKKYKTDTEYQLLLRHLIAKYPYRLDTNFAKIDRIGFNALEAFKIAMLGATYHNQTIQEWINVIAHLDANALYPFIDASAPPEVQ